MKVWDLVAALDPRSPSGTLCLRTLVVISLCFCLILTTLINNFNASSMKYQICQILVWNVSFYHTFCFAFQEHTGRVFRLQFDEFQIVSSSHDDTILIWDFLNCDPLESNAAEAPSSQCQPVENRTPSRK